MSDKDFKIVSFDEFVEYLNTLKGQHICPMCEEESWTLYTPSEMASDDSGKFVVSSIPGSFISNETLDKKGIFFRSPAFDILTMQCKNCGYMNLFNYQKVAKNISSGDYIKMSENGSEEKAGDDDTSEN